MFEPILLGIILIPVAISLFCKFALKWDISWVEFAAQFGIGVLSLSLIWFIGNNFVGIDREVLNGQVTGKHYWQFSCPTNTSNPCTNGYQCHPVTTCSGTGSNKSCSTHYDTCYVYPWEQNWYADTDLPNMKTTEIARVDDQGAIEPPRYTSTHKGDPASSTELYKNWVKASANSLFKDDAVKEEANKALMVEYPIKINDYYNINRIITPNITLPNKAAWNLQLAQILETLGPSKQMNIVVVMVDGVGRDYALGLRRHWKGFKKNDAVIVIGLKGGAIQWAEVMSWSKNSLFNVEMRNMIEEAKDMPLALINPAEFMKNVQDISQRDFVRRRMHEFEYLRSDIPPPTWLIVLTSILAVGVGIGTSILFNRIDLTNLGSNSYRRPSFRY